MIQDLLFNDKDRLKNWLSQRQYVRTSEIIRWGCENYSNRANRNKQEFVQMGLLKRLSHEEKDRLFGLLKEDVYEVMDYRQTEAA